MDKFWRWVVNEAEENPVRTLYLEGYIAEDSWFDDDITPRQFKTDLYGDGISDDIIVKIHSPGGDCFAAAQIYNMIKEYPGHVSVHVDGLAASAASVIAMAGDEVCLSPLSVIMIHNPAMLVAGEVADLEAGINLLSEVKESIINAYQIKSGLSRAKISHMMDAETWMSAHKAIELKFADKILYEEAEIEDTGRNFIFDKLTVTNTLLNKMPKIKNKMQQLVVSPVKETHQSMLTANIGGATIQDSKIAENIGSQPINNNKERHELEDLERLVPVNQLEKRLELIKNWR